MVPDEFRYEEEDVSVYVKGGGTHSLYTGEKRERREKREHSPKCAEWCAYQVPLVVLY
jgi:hypothetical protein